MHRAVVSTGLAVALITITAVTISLAIVGPILARRQLIDVPNHRSAHTLPTVRGAGAGIVAGLLVGLACCGLLLPDREAQLLGVVGLGFAAGALSIVGLVEDIRGLRIGVRLIGQASIVAITTAGLAHVAGTPVILGLLAAIAGVFYINAANFMDGVNGISGLHGAVVGAYFTVVGLSSGAPGLILSAVAVGSAFLAFLPWNAPRARVFMGDVGSYALGGAVWVLAVWALMLGVSWLTVVAPLLVYSTDVATTLVRRARHGAHLTQAHHEHVYQRVQEITHSHGKAALLATAGTMACAAIGLWSWFVPDATIWAIAVTVAVLALYVATPWLLERRLTTTAWSDGVLR